MMLSILIPIYNENCVNLVSDLLIQAKALACPYEILVFDDFSPIQYKENEIINQWENTTFKTLSENLGRAKIRNLLADSAKGDVLLFLDGDSGIVRNDFLKKYLEEIESTSVVRGGTVYCSKDKIDKSYALHWKYGTLIESNRERQGKDMFTTNNFCLRKEVFKSVKFDERIKGYGHEDTVFKFELSKQGFSFKNIDNPVEHLGLKNFEDFITSTQNAVVNLKKLSAKNEFKDSLQNIKLIKAYNLLAKYHLAGFYRLFFKLTKGIMLRMLKNENPNLKILDLYKRGIFCIS